MEWVGDLLWWAVSGVLGFLEKVIFGAVDFVSAVLGEYGPVIAALLFLWWVMWMILDGK